MAFLANLLNVASMIWRAEAKSYGSFMGACVVTGIACGPSETLPGMVRLILQKALSGFSLTPVAASRRCHVPPPARPLHEPLSMDRMVWNIGEHREPPRNLWVWYYSPVADTLVGRSCYRWSHVRPIRLAKLLVALRCHCRFCPDIPSALHAGDSMGGTARRDCS